MNRIGAALPPFNTSSKGRVIVNDRSHSLSASTSSRVEPNDSSALGEVVNSEPVAPR